MGMVGEGKKSVKSLDKLCMERYILVLNIAFQLGCHI